MSGPLECSCGSTEFVLVRKQQSLPFSSEGAKDFFELLETAKTDKDLKTDANYTELLCAACGELITDYNEE